MTTNTAPYIGQPLDRVDGPLKVRGRATYAYEFEAARQTAVGFIVPATIAKGRVAMLDVRAAERAPGILLVLTHLNAPAQAPFGPPRGPNRFSRARPVLADDRVRYWGEAVALVVAETFEAARHAATLIGVEYAPESQRTDLATSLALAYKPEGVTATGKAPTDTALGDFDAAFAAAPVTVSVTYDTAYQVHTALEAHATLAEWEGARLTLHTSTQTVADTRAAVASTLRMSLDDVRIISPYVGGGFGGKLGVRPEAIFAALAARMLRRPVKVAQTRQQTFQSAGHRPASIQTVRLAAARDGRLTGIAHEAIIQSTPFEEFAEQNAMPVRSLYAAPNRITRHRLVPLDMPGGEPVRAPGEAPGLLALESAMDELAVALDMDPIELRVVNEPALDPERGVPYSSRHLVQCLREGATRFGWADRPRTPASRRDGRWLVGYGVAAGIRSNYRGPAEAEAALQPDGMIAICTDMTDIGTGTYTILTQIAADALGMPPDSIQVALGDSRFPRSPGSGGSWGAASSGSAVKAAAEKLRAMIVEHARTVTGSPFAAVRPEEIRIEGGLIRSGGASTSVAAVAATLGQALAARGSIIGMADDPNYRAYSQHGFGGHFAEVGVDIDTGEIRLRRMLGVFAVGRVLNAKTARSQMIGGMIWGLSQALHEEAVVDPRFGQFVNHDLAQYHVPVHADLPDVDAFFIPEEDDKGNPLGIKGIGELGICGSGAAVANAVFNATGVRVRQFPITLDKVLPGLPAQSS